MFSEIADQRGSDFQGDASYVKQSKQFEGVYTVLAKRLSSLGLTQSFFGSLKLGLASSRRLVSWDTL